MSLGGTAGLGATWPGDKRVSAPGRVRPPAREDALSPYQDAGRRGTLHHKPRGTVVAGVHPRSDAALCGAGFNGQAGRDAAAVPSRIIPLQSVTLPIQMTGRLQSRAPFAFVTGRPRLSPKLGNSDPRISAPEPVSVQGLFFICGGGLPVGSGGDGGVPPPAPGQAFRRGPRGG